MNDQAPARAPGLWIWDNLPQLAAAALLCGILWGTLTFLFGGFQPKSQVDLHDALDRLTKLEAVQASAGQTSISDRTANTTAIEAAKQIINSRLDAMPRTKDFSDWEGHLSKLDGRADAAEHRISDAEYNIRDLTNKYGALTSTARK